MAVLQGRKRIKSFFKSGYFALFLFLIFFWMGGSVFNVYKKDRLAQENRAKIKKEFDVLEKKKNSLQYEINRLQSQDGVEEELRRRFQVAKEGEQILIIVDKDEEKKEIPIVLEKESVWSSIWKEMMATLSF